MFNSIFWEAIGKALNSFSNSHQTTLVKHCNGILPMGKVLEQRRELECPHCTSCKSDTLEDTTHMLDCREHSQWRDSARTRFSNQLQSFGTRREVSTFLGRLLFRVPRLPLRNDLNVLQDDCDKIGRVELWRGRLPKSLVEWQHTFITKGASTQKIGSEGARWATRVVKSIFGEFLNLWWLRNDIRHGRNETEESEARRMRAKRRCLALEPRIKRLKPSTRKLFVDEETWKKWRTREIISYANWASDMVKLHESIFVRGSRTDWDVTEGEVIDPP